MIPKDIHLVTDIYESTSNAILEPTRDGFGRALVDAGEKDNRIVALCADLAESTRMEWFKKKFPERYIELGVAEQNLATVASGMAAAGKIPFIASYATFSPGRNNEQIRTTIALNEQPVKIIGSHAGLSVGPDGATHQALEDIGLMRMMPHMTVVVPADAQEAYQLTLQSAIHPGPVYIRLARHASAVMTTPQTPCVLGKASIWFDPEHADIGIIASGPIIYQAMCAAHMLAEKGISVAVMNLATIKPLDVEGVLAYAGTKKALITIEEHQRAGGMGSAVVECIAEHHPMIVVRMGVDDMFGQSGTPEELLAHYQLDTQAIINTVHTLLKKIS